MADRRFCESPNSLSRRKVLSGLAHEHHIVALVAKRLAEQPFAVALPIDVGGIEQDYAAIDGMLN